LIMHQTAMSGAAKIKVQTAEEFKKEVEKMTNDQLLKSMTDHMNTLAETTKCLPKKPKIEQDVAYLSSSEYIKPRVEIITAEIAKRLGLTKPVQEKDKITQERTQDKQRVAKLDNNELRYELDLRWQRLGRASSTAIANRAFECLKKWIRFILVYMTRHGGTADMDIDENIRLAGLKSGAQNIFSEHGRGVLLLTVPKPQYKKDANLLLLLNYMGDVPAKDREYFDCLYDITIDAEIATFGHIYQLTLQEEADIKAKAKADPLKNPYMKK